MITYKYKNAYGQIIWLTWLVMVELAFFNCLGLISFDIVFFGNLLKSYYFSLLKELFKIINIVVKVWTPDSNLVAKFCFHWIAYVILLL